MVVVARVVSDFLWVPAVMVVCQVCSVYAENVLGVQTDEFDFDGLPGATHEFKVHIPGQSMDCFFQPVAEGAQLFVSFEVLRGGDGLVDFYIRDKNWRNIEVQLNKKSNQYTMARSNADTYAICIDNRRYGNKLVYFWISTFVMQEWTDFQMELADMRKIARNFTSAIDIVTEQVSLMSQSQMSARFHVVKDWYLLQSNNDYVYRWSLSQCVLVVLSALAQVYTVRRLFRTVNVTPSLKPRA